jgi:hypothetical protein
MVWCPSYPRQCLLSLRVVAACSVHPVSERHRQALQSALVRRWVRPCELPLEKNGTEVACIRRSHRAYRFDAPASRCQQRGGWTTRVSAPYINSSVGALSAFKSPPGTLALGIALRFGHRRVAGSSRALHLMRLVLELWGVPPSLTLSGSCSGGGSSSSSSSSSRARSTTTRRVRVIVLLSSTLTLVEVIITYWHGTIWYGAPSTPRQCAPVTERGGFIEHLHDARSLRQAGHQSALVRGWVCLCGRWTGGGCTNCCAPTQPKSSGWRCDAPVT